MSVRGNAALRGWQMLLVYVSGSFGLGFQSMIVFLLPLRAKELGAPLPVIGLIISAGTLLPALLAIGSGVLIDRFGARRAFIVCTASTALSTLAFVAISNFWLLGALQLVNGFLRNSGWVASQTYVTGLGTPQQRPSILGRFSLSANLGPFLGPLFAGFVADARGFGAAFVVVALIGACYAIIGLALPKTGVASAGTVVEVRSGRRAMLGLLQGRGVQIALILTCVRLWSPAGWQPFYQLFLHEHGFRTALIGMVLAARAAVAVPTTLAAGTLARFSSKEMAAAGTLALGALGVALSPFVASMPLAFLPAILLGAGDGITLPILIALMAEDAPPGQLGVALGLRNGVNQAANTLAPIASGAFVSSFGITVGFGVNSTMALAALAGALWLKLASRAARGAKPSGPVGA